jgi:hypothetical protein
VNFNQTANRAAILTITAGFLTLAGCGGGSQESAKPSTQTVATKAPAEAAKPATSTLTGKITLQGPAPKNTPIKMDADAVCKSQHPTEALSENYIVGPGGELANVFVYVKSGVRGSYPVPADTVVFDQKGCEYYPHVFGMRVNQPLAIVNSDPTLHNVHPQPKNSPGFNVGMPTKGMRVTKTFTAPEVMVKIKCDVHSWMNAYAGVVDNPFFAVTGKDGNFSIGPLPPGTYEIEAWHEKLGTMTQTVTVADNETKSVPFSFGPVK